MLNPNNTENIEAVSPRRAKATKSESNKKAMYSLCLPEEVLGEIRRVAKKEDVTILQVIRNFIKFGLTFFRMKENDPSTTLIIRQGNTEQVIFWFS